MAIRQRCAPCGEWQVARAPSNSRHRSGRLEHIAPAIRTMRGTSEQSLGYSRLGTIKIGYFPPAWGAGECVGARGDARGGESQAQHFRSVILSRSTRWNMLRDSAVANETAASRAAGSRPHHTSPHFFTCM